MSRKPSSPDGSGATPAENRIARLVRAAQLYYEEESSQQEIADRMQVSRASVSRMLTEAREEGIVTITISRPFQHRQELEDALVREFGLKHAAVVPTSIDEEATLDVIGRATAELFSTVVSENDIIGISWGRTINRVVRAIGDPRLDGLSVIQMLGSLGAGDPTIDGHEIARRLGERIHAPYQFVNAPAIVDDAEDGARLREVRAVNRVLTAAAEADLVLFSVGTLTDPDTSLSRAGYLTEAERLDLLRRGGVGHVLAKIVTREGTEIPEFNDRVIAVDLKTLRTPRWSICVAASRDKAAVMTGVLAGGYANAIVVDSDLAEAVLRGQGEG